MTKLYDSELSIDSPENLIPFLANGSNLPNDTQYIEAYNDVFEILKTIFQGNKGYPRFIKSKISQKTSATLENLSKKSIYAYLNSKYQETVDAGLSFSDYIEGSSSDLYSAVLGQERVVLSNITDNLNEYKFTCTNDKEKLEYISQLLLLITSNNTNEIAFLYTMIGKVLEGSLSQARKSVGGNIAEKIIEVLLEQQHFDVKSQDGSRTATNTDLVVKTKNHTHCIAVQLSTNDRMRLSTDEYQTDSINYLVSLNGCSVSRKNLNDISLQRMSTWTKEHLDQKKMMPYYVGISSFIENMKKSYLQNLIDYMKKDPTKLAFTIQKGYSSILTPFFYTNTVIPTSDPTYENLFLLAYWAHNYTLSFEQFIEKIKSDT